MLGSRMTDGAAARDAYTDAHRKKLIRARELAAAKVQTTRDALLAGQETGLPSEIPLATQEAIKEEALQPDESALELTSESTEAAILEM